MGSVAGHTHMKEEGPPPRPGELSSTPAGAVLQPLGSQAPTSSLSLFAAREEPQSFPDPPQQQPQEHLANSSSSNNKNKAHTHTHTHSHSHTHTHRSSRPGGQVSPGPQAESCRGVSWATGVTTAGQVPWGLGLATPAASSMHHHRHCWS